MEAGYLCDATFDRHFSAIATDILCFIQNSELREHGEAFPAPALTTNLD